MRWIRTGLDWLLIPMCFAEEQRICRVISPGFACVGLRLIQNWSVCCLVNDVAWILLVVMMIS